MKEIPFDEQVLMTSYCHIWLGSHNNMGYGVLYRGRQWLTHRWAWTQVNGDIPAGKILMHICDNPACVRVSHLRLGTMRDNTHDMVRKKRDKNSHKTHCIYGHEFTPANTYKKRNGNRKCKRCTIDAVNKRRKAKRVLA